MAQASVLGSYAAEARQEQARQEQRERPLTVWKIALGVFLGMEMFGFVSGVIWGVIYLLLR